MPSRRPPRQRWRRRLETEQEEVWGEGERGGEGGTERWLGGGAGGRAGGCSCRRHLGGSRLPGGRSAERSTAEPREAARAPAPNPEPRARAAAAAASRPRVPGHAAAARKAAGAQQVASAPLRPGKVSLAAAGRSWRGVQPLALEGRGLGTSVLSVRRAAAPPGTWRLHARPPPQETVGHGGGWEWNWGGSQDGPGEALEPSST